MHHWHATLSQMRVNRITPAEESLSGPLVLEEDGDLVNLVVPIESHQEEVARLIHLSFGVDMNMCQGSHVLLTEHPVLPFEGIKGAPRPIEEVHEMPHDLVPSRERSREGVDSRNVVLRVGRKQLNTLINVTVSD